MLFPEMFRCFSVREFIRPCSQPLTEVKNSIPLSCRLLCSRLRCCSLKLFEMKYWRVVPILLEMLFFPKSILINEKLLFKICSAPASTSETFRLNVVFCQLQVSQRLVLLERLRDHVCPFDSNVVVLHAERHQRAVVDEHRRDDLGADEADRVFPDAFLPDANLG